MLTRNFDWLVVCLIGLACSRAAARAMGGRRCAGHRAADSASADAWQQQLADGARPAAVKRSRHCRP